MKGLPNETAFLISCFIVVSIKSYSIANNGGCWCPSVYQPQNGRRYCRLESRLPSNYNLASSLGNSFCNGYADRDASENEKRRKIAEGLPAKNRGVWTASFTLVDQLQDPGSPGGFRQTNYYKLSPLRKFFSFKHSDMETSERTVRTAVLLLCTVYSKVLLCLLFRFP